MDKLSDFVSIIEETGYSNNNHNQNISIIADKHRIEVSYSATIKGLEILRDKLDADEGFTFDCKYIRMNGALAYADVTLVRNATPKEIWESVRHLDDTKKVIQF